MVASSSAPASHLQAVRLSALEGEASYIGSSSTGITVAGVGNGTWFVLENLLLSMMQGNEDG